MAEEKKWLKTRMIVEPDESRWGVFEIAFPKIVYDIQDLKDCFQFILPEIITLYEKWKTT